MNNKIKVDRPEIVRLDFSGSLAKTVLDSLSANIAILDENGVILETNQAWKNYATINQMQGSNDSIGVNYLELCDATTGKEAKDARNVAAGIRSVIKGSIKEFLYDYPCHGPDGRHFYYLRAIRVAEKEPIRVVVSHEDITALKLAEEALLKREKERDRLRHSLELAKEVQQKLLPKVNPRIDGLEVAGKSIYCDETGGDYYDFIQFKENANKKWGVVVGDVAGHGISSALLMATVRSALRQRFALPGSISQMIADVNRQLAGDFADSGQFVTLFYLAVDPARQTLEWVRAGHEPAIFYNPAANEFLELAGSGMALGVDKHCQYEKNRIDDFPRGSIIVIGTDGVWEARNDRGEMFGRTAIYDIIRSNSEAGVDDIMEAIFEQIKKFRNAAEPEDDVTLVVLKLL
ncbi:MAG: SpoIIE family protein phosphatase [Desulfobacterales bacterium]|jgi:serine phosphatase RsbU (regulator of sigma subunit)